jgi:hypothetical protein
MMKTGSLQAYFLRFGFGVGFVLFIANLFQLPVPVRAASCSGGCDLGTDNTFIGQCGIGSSGKCVCLDDNGRFLGTFGCANS